MNIAIANGFELGTVCRNCKHVNAFHVDGHDNEQNVPCEHPKSKRNRNKYCMCLNFDPRSNLRYLADKYKGKHGK